MSVHHLPLPLIRDIDKLKEVAAEIEDRLAQLIDAHCKIKAHIRELENNNDEK